MASTTKACPTHGPNRRSLHARLVSANIQWLDSLIFIDTVGIGDPSGLFLLSRVSGSAAAAVCLTLSSPGLCQLVIPKATTSRSTGNQCHLRNTDKTCSLFDAAHRNARYKAERLRLTFIVIVQVTGCSESFLVSDLLMN